MIEVEHGDNFDVNAIGDGYRNIAYRVNKETRIGEIILYGYDKKNRPQTYKFEHYSHIKYNVQYETKEKDIFGKNIATKQFRNVYDRNKWMKSLDGSINIMECLRPEQEFLQSRFHKAVNDPEFNTQKMRIHYLDIEIAIQDEFPEAKEAKYPINLITVYDSHHERYYTWAMPHADQKLVNSLTDDHDIILFKFDNEIDLIKSYVEWTENNRPDVVTGWNTKFFDMPYIIRRIENILTPDYAKKMSPVADYYITENRENPKEININIKGLTQLDLMVLYRDKFMFKIDGGYKLDNVCEVELSANKLHFKGSFKEFYQTQFQKFFEYNVRDVELLVKLEAKLQLIDLSRAITTSGLCQTEAIYTSISYLIGSLSTYSMNERMGVFPTFKDKNSDMGSEKFEGAYVFPTQSGFYNNGVIGIDLASLYPNDMIAQNISPETKVGQLHVIDDDNYHLYRKAGKVKKITGTQLTKLTDQKCIISKNNTLFYKHAERKGIVTGWLQDAYNTRVKYKKLSAKYASKADKETDPELKREYMEQSARYDHIQYAQKIKLNSVYGCFGTPYSPIYDPDIAQSVTLTGQFINRSVSDMLRGKFGDEAIIAGDTDSIYIDIESVTERYAKKFGRDDIRGFSRSEVKEMLKELDAYVTGEVNDFAANLVNTECCTTEGHNIKYERELLASEAIFFKKKHYLMHLIDVEGKKADKFKYMGIAVKKGELPASIKTFLKEIYENTCRNGWGYDEYRDYLNEVYDKFLKFEFEDISEWKGYRTEKESTGFLQVEKGALAQVRGIHYYNQFIDDMKLKDKYAEIRLGDMIRFCYIHKSNTYGVDVISFIDESFPDEFRDIFTIDYIRMFNKLVMKPLSGYVKAMGFMDYTPTNQMVDDVFDL